MKPRISVVIPTFNRAQFIERAVGSALNQTYEAIEVIVIDDGSSDDTQARLQALQERDPRLRYLRHQTNWGAQAARNTGIRVAEGEYVALLDSDDEWQPAKLEKQLELFDKGPDGLGVVYCGYQTVWVGQEQAEEKCFALRGQVYESLLAGYGVGPTSILLAKKSALDRVGCFDEQVPAYQEWDVCIRLAREYQFDYVPEALVIYHCHDSPSISRNRLANIREYLNVVSRYRDEIESKCGKAALLQHRTIARRRFSREAYRELLQNNSHNASKAFLLSAVVPPLSLKLLGHALLSLTGAKTYMRVYGLRHKDHLRPELY